MFPRVLHWAGGIGMRSARQAEVLAMGFANNGAARIQNTETMDPLSRARLQSLLGEVYFKL